MNQMEILSPSARGTATKLSRVCVFSSYEEANLDPSHAPVAEKMPEMPAKPKSSPKDSSANLGFEAKLWLAADKLRNNMDATTTAATR